MHSSSAKPREPGFWWDSIGGPPPRRPPLRGRVEADVAIVGAGLTGLWSAYYLKRSQPSLEVVVLEREFAGFGASGRNGGWVSGFFSGAARTYERMRGREGLAALQRAMFATVDEIGGVLAAEGIDAEFSKPGQLSVALGPAQLARLRAGVASARERGVGAQDLRELGQSELQARVRVQGALGATFSPHVARVHPAKLVSGLAGAVERLGVTIHEDTPVTHISPRAARTPGGELAARWVVRASEGYTPSLPGLRRLLAPLNSSMVVTEPLAPEVWREIGWEGGELLDDAAHVYVYLQRTPEGRIAIGGRGMPYRYASRTDRGGETPLATVSQLRAKLLEMFPATRDARVDHAWSGVLGVPRDWCPTVAADPASGLAWAGGYVGLGVGASNLAARTLRDLILGERSALTALPWVGHDARRWEPEPLRWGAIRGVYALYRLADARERRSGRPSRLGALVDRFSRRE